MSDIQTILDTTYNELSIEERKELHEMYRQCDSADEMHKKIRKLIFRIEPPTPAEYLDHRNGWITKGFADSVYPYIKEDFIEILDEVSNYNQVVEYGATRCEAENTPILMYDMSIKMIQDVKVGDLLMGDDSTPRTVLETVTGFGDLYEVHQNKGDNYTVNENHELVLQYTNKGLRKDRNNTPDKSNGKTIEVPVKDYLEFSKSKKHRLKGLKTGLTFNSQEVLIDPYWLGLHQGDGNSHNTGITSEDKEIIDYIYAYADKLDYKITINYKKDNSANTYTTVNKVRTGVRDLEKRNKLLYWMKQYNVINNKHIPMEYIQNSEEIRLELLAGIIDSDGNLDKRGHIYEITLKDIKLVEGVVLLCRTLGFRTNYKKVTKSIKSIGFTGEYYRILISGHLYKIPCRLKRKQAIKKEPKFNPLRTGIKVTKLEEPGNFYGFALDGNQRYLHGDLTITHNTGKSFLNRMLIHYIVIFVHCLRHPQLYYGVAPTTSLSIYIMSFVAEKVNQLLLKPIYDIFMMSPRFIRVGRQDQVATKQQEIGLEKIVWSKAATFGKMTLESKLSLNIGTDMMSFIGADLLFLSVSEINFFIEQAGVSHDQIFQLYSDGFERIKATVGDNYLGMVYLDSSANDIENPIENYILNDVQKQEKVYFRSRSRWEARPYLFPIWQKTGETFKVCVGSQTIQPHIITDIKQLNDINPRLIIHVPIDAKPDFERNLIKSIKDIAGLPAQNENRLIQDFVLIEDLFNNKYLTNIEGTIIADASENPEKLIWNKVKDTFFRKTLEGKYKIMRAYREPRWIHVDPAFSASGDLAGIAMGHKERSRHMEKTVYVLDFAFCIAPGKTGINLASIEQFILDLMYEGGVYIKYMSSDSFQNAQFKQTLARNGIETSVLSVDRTIDPYMFFVNCMFDRVVKVGRNIFMKNNLLSLITDRNDKGKEKIDHIKGQTEHKYFGGWEYSQAGINDKDCSDAGAGVLYHMSNSEIIPITFYEDENGRYDSVDSNEISTKNFQNALLGIHSGI